MPEPPVYLASGSPRRRELMRQIGLDFEVVPADIDESARPSESAEALVRRLAAGKARAAAAVLSDGALTVAADTVVVVDGEVLGKPADRDDAVRMLARLSGRSHRVLTAVTGTRGARQLAALSETVVCFRPIGDGERQAYVDSGECDDKAGAYAIQGRGALFVERIDGSYSGVMGLPLFETGVILAALGVDVLGRARAAN